MSLVISEMWQERQSYRQKNDSGACSKLLSETRDTFSTLVPSGGEMTKEPLYVFSVFFRNAEREHSPFMSFLERKWSENNSIA